MLKILKVNNYYYIVNTKNNNEIISKHKRKYIAQKHLDLINLNLGYYYRQDVGIN